jgi:hypothetical protein
MTNIKIPKMKAAVPSSTPADASNVRTRSSPTGKGGSADYPRSWIAERPGEASLSLQILCETFTHGDGSKGGTFTPGEPGIPMSRGVVGRLADLGAKDGLHA